MQGTEAADMRAETLTLTTVEVMADIEAVMDIEAVTVMAVTADMVMDTEDRTGVLLSVMISEDPYISRDTMFFPTRTVAVMCIGKIMHGCFPLPFRLS
jgi:hypothetical protein